MIIISLNQLSSVKIAIYTSVMIRTSHVPQCVLQYLSRSIPKWHESAMIWTLNSEFIILLFFIINKYHVRYSSISRQSCSSERFNNAVFPEIDKKVYTLVGYMCT